jgi:tetratricopeptide (TPR) repeat protein
MIMKKLFGLLMITLITAGAYAQPSKVVSTYNYLRYGEFKKAKEAIDLACSHEKTMNDAKTWWYAGQAYQGIVIKCMFNSEAEYCTLSPDGAEIAKENYKKALNLNMKDPKWRSMDIFKNEADLQVFLKLIQDQNNILAWDITYDIVFQRFPGMSSIFVNKGISEFESDDPALNKKAAESFETSLIFSSLTKMDTAVIFYIALASDKVKDHKKAIEYYKKVVKMEYGKDDQAKSLNYYYLAQNYLALGEKDNYVETLKSGIKKYEQGSTALVTELINFYLGNDQTEDDIINGY